VPLDVDTLMARSFGGGRVSASRPKSWPPTMSGVRRMTNLAASSTSSAWSPISSAVRHGNSTSATALIALKAQGGASGEEV